MPKFASAIETQRIPVRGLVPETSATAPTTPVVGQLWVDTSVTPRVLRIWDGSAWTPLNIYAGTGATNYVAGNDARLTDQRTPLDNSVTAAKVVDGSLTDAEIAAGNKDGAAATPSLRTLGTGATQAAAGNDARLTDTRTPTDGSVTTVKIAAGAVTGTEISGTIKDAAAGTASLRTLGTGAGQAAAGNDVRLTDQRVPTDGSVTAVKIADGTITDVKIAAANKDGTAGTASLRTLGFGAVQALAGTTRLDQIAAPTAAVDFNGQRGVNVGAPVAATDIARLADVQGAAAGIDAKPSARVRAATNINTAAPGATIDGVTMAAGDRVLLTGQTTATENDIWIWNGAATAMTRSTDTITPNTFLFVEDGTSADTQWVVTNNGTITRGTTTIVWTQFGAASAYTGTANRITVTGTSIDISASYVGQTSITTVGTITVGTWNGTAIAVANGGTGATTAAGARTNLGVARAGFAADLGAITAGATVTVTHSLGTQDVLTQVRETATQQVVELDITNSSTTQVSIRSDVAYAAGALRVVVLPVV